MIRHNRPPVPHDKRNPRQLRSNKSIVQRRRAPALCRIGPYFRRHRPDTVDCTQACPQRMHAVWSRIACLPMHPIWGSRKSCVKTEEPRSTTSARLIFGSQANGDQQQKDIDKTPAKQGADAVISEPNKIGPSTPYDPTMSRNEQRGGGMLCKRRIRPPSRASPN